MNNDGTTNKGAKRKKEEDKRSVEDEKRVRQNYFKEIVAEKENNALAATPIAVDGGGQLATQGFPRRTTARN